MVYSSRQYSKVSSGILGKELFEPSVESVGPSQSSGLGNAWTMIPRRFVVCWALEFWQSFPVLRADTSFFFLFRSRMIKMALKGGS